MPGLETALAATTVRFVGEELLNWIRQRGPDFSESDWEEMGLQVGRELRADYENVKAAHLHKSNEPDIVKKIGSAARIYRELQFVGEDHGFNSDIIKIYSELADLCAKWEDYTNSFGEEEYMKLGEDFLELHNSYKEQIK